MSGSRGGGTVVALRPSNTDGPRERIHAAAVRLFARRGFHGTSLQMIADEVGLHKSSLFHHYSGKTELAQEVFQAAMAELVTRMEGLADSAPENAHSLLAALEDVAMHLCDAPDTARLILAVIVAPQDSPFKAPADHPPDDPVVRFYTLLWEWLEGARRNNVIRALNIRQTIFNLIGLVLLYPAVAREHPLVAGLDPFSESARRHRLDELRRAVTGILGIHGDAS